MPCIGPLHRPRGGPKPDFNFAYLSHPPSIGDNVDDDNYDCDCDGYLDSTVMCRG